MIPEGTGLGAIHGGTSKFTFGCHEPNCLTSAVVDCRQEKSCETDDECDDGERCLGGGDSFCRISDSVCDLTYVNFVRFAEYFASCSK